MAKLYFNFSAMNAGKSAQLLQSAHNYESNGGKVKYFNFKGDTRFSEGMIVSRIGIEHAAELFDVNYKFNIDEPVDAIFIDEAQFLTAEQVKQLCKIVDTQHVPVLCYGIRNDYMGNLFEGSASLMCHADVINEIKGMCSHKECNKKATHILLYADGKIVLSGEQVHIGDTEYHSVCRNHFHKLRESV